MYEDEHGEHGDIRVEIPIHNQGVSHFNWEEVNKGCFNIAKKIKKESEDRKKNAYINRLRKLGV